jgi:hypothetical protein
MNLVCRFASIDDWPMLRAFYGEIYRPHHPLHDLEFWRWQFGDARYGRAAIVSDGERVVGHLGTSLAGGFGWLINGYLMEKYRGQGWLAQLYGLAATLAPNAATNINRAGMDMYRNMGFTRYADLQRYTAVAPGITPDTALAPAGISRVAQPRGHRYWEQPGIVGTTLSDGSTAVVQAQLGGLRVVHIADPAQVLAACWEAGARWADFITSWNDPLCRELDRRHGWTLGDGISWRLDPIVPGSRSDISVTAQTALPPRLIIDRTFSDHGRIGSLSAPAEVGSRPSE